MIQSMTGYGRAAVAYKDKKIRVEVKSLNSKALDLSTRIAPVFREKEMEMRQIIAKRLVRGKVDFALWVEKADGLSTPPINETVVASYYQQIKTISEHTGIPQPANWYDVLLRLPDVMSKPEEEEVEPEEWEAVNKAVEAALDDLVAFRKQEGAALEKKFHEKVDNIEALLKSIEPYEKSRVPKIKEAIIKGLEQIPEVEYDKNRLEQELIYYIEKLDISEEKQRLTNHLKYFRETLAEDKPNGKKLGFIAQEMGREINTTGSKSNQAEMQNIVVKMKDELEQIKEQVLNAL